MTIGERIKKIRKSKGLTQKQLENKTGINQANIRKYESGRQNPKFETLEKIANALEVPVWDLMGLEDMLKTSIESLQKEISNLMTDPKQSLNETATNLLKSAAGLGKSAIHAMNYSDLEGFMNYISSWGVKIEIENEKYYLVSKDKRVEMSEEELMNLLRSARAAVRGLLMDILEKDSDPIDTE